MVALIYLCFVLPRIWDLTSSRPARQPTILTAKPCQSARVPSLHAPTLRDAWTSLPTVRLNYFFKPHIQKKPVVTNMQILQMSMNIMKVASWLVRCIVFNCETALDINILVITSSVFCSYVTVPNTHSLCWSISGKSCIKKIFFCSQVIWMSWSSMASVLSEKPSPLSRTSLPRYANSLHTRQMWHDTNPTTQKIHHLCPTWDIHLSCLW